MRIKTLLLLLVLAVWLPAVLGLGLLARSTYGREAQDAREDVERVARDLNTLVERELDKRVVMARTLAASPALADGDLQRFHAEATLATRNTQDWAIVVDRRRQQLNTQVPFEGYRAIERSPEAHFVTGDPAVYFSPRALVNGMPVLGAFAADLHVAPPRYNVAIAFAPAVVQAVVGAATLPEGSLASVIDQAQVIIARSRDPQKWVGKRASPYIRDLVHANAGVFLDSVTLDGVPSLTYIAKTNAYGWTVVLALPQSALLKAARRLTTQVVAASTLILLLSLAIALYGAHRLGAVVVALRQAATRLGDDEVPPLLRTGVVEADEVSLALHDAGVKAHEAARLLEQRVEEAVRRAEEAQARLLEGQKLEAIGRLTGGLAHDFNNLLQTISIGLQVLDRTLGDFPKRRTLQACIDASRKAAAVVRQMLAFGRRQASAPQAVDIKDFLLRHQELTERALGGRARLVAAIAQDAPLLFVDPAQLELTLLNLVFNARDAMPSGGTITIGMRPAEGCETATLPAGRYACLEVADAGIGMDDATRARAFDPYFTTKPIGAGSGLGLAQVRSFARESHGDAQIDSRPGEGTRVRLYLPVAAAAAVDAGRADAPRHVRDGMPALKILMVEDDVLISSVVVPALLEGGHQVTLRESADDAKALLETGAEFEIVFTDIMMPGTMNGIDLMAWCAEHRPNLALLAATGYSTRRPAAGVRILQKPYDMEQLVEGLREAMRGAAATSG
ncbi:MAG: response regulator [Proteobacteria bacterium]|nr:response regulator [Pseudomonadota bacterium]